MPQLGMFLWPNSIDRVNLEQLEEMVEPLEDNILLEPLAFSFRDYAEVKEKRDDVIGSVMKNVQAYGKTLDDRITMAETLPPNSQSREVLRRLLLLKKIMVEKDPSAKP